MRKEREIAVPSPRGPVTAAGPPAGPVRPSARRPGARERVRYWVDRTVVKGMTALVGWLALACLAVVAPASALLVWTDSRAPVTFEGKLAAVWRTVGQTLRLGGEVGPPLRIVLSVLLALVALLYVSTLVGLVTTALTDRLTELQRGHSTVLEEGHTLVLGWSEQAPTVIAELLAAYGQRRGGAVVVLADRDKTEMEEELRGDGAVAGRVRLLCRRGRPADPAALARVSPATAEAVVVLPPDDPAEDAQVVRTLLALRAAVGEGCPVRVVAAVRADRYREAAELAAGEGATVLEVDDIAARLLARCVREPGLSFVLEDLLDFAGAELHTLREPGLAGRSFGELRAGGAEVCAVGIVRADGTLLLNPAPDVELGAGDGLVVLAEDGGATALSPPSTVPAADPAVMTTPPPRSPRPSRVVVLGWNRRAGRVVEALAHGAPPGSVVDVVTDAAGATDVTGVVTRVAAGAGGGAGARVDEGPGGAGQGTVVPAVVVHPGDPTTAAALRRVGAEHDHVVVLGPDHGPEPVSPDDRTLVTLLHLRARQRRAGLTATVVTELADARNRPLAPVGAAADVLVTGRLVGLLMAQIAQNGALAAAFGELFSGRGNAVRLRPAGDFVTLGAEVTFATVVASAGRQGACALGYRAAGAAESAPYRGVRLNPPKDETRCWSEGDEVIVVARQ
ncbi:NAD-binding lipoprotein [Streptomyces sp. NPDC006339]|uniref:CASTOR/POLLUX-related putative ion channel n=1 Tax=Streptomyces sp. NPDC006339 TaxID=3156755 RepID=UPI0033B4ABA7